MSAANVNEYMNKLSTLLNWAVKEELLSRNPGRGLRLADTVTRRDKRHPFSAGQLKRIFNAPLFRGCRDDGHGFAIPGAAKPRRARFWIPLISLYSGMRLNEICQIKVADVREIDGVICFAISARDYDQHLKTAASERVIPVHPALIRIGLLTYLAARRSNGDIRLFPELRMDLYGFYSGSFSKWFTRFLVSCEAAEQRTCFHSFRHSFRDALREARVDRELALAIGGWTSLSGGGNAVADSYGGGYSAVTIFRAISSIDYPLLDLSHLYCE